ncbi:MAG: hypothetical protein HYU02_03885 [Thaumarchaeota archaeon]|nr:hypothetical protein [Nitrososphaerota archaeon]
MERHILENLSKTRSPMNISQITRAIRAEGGTASRRIVGKKLASVESSGLVKMLTGKKGEKLYLRKFLAKELNSRV